MKSIVTTEDIVALIPQKPPMVMIDKVFEVSKTHCSTGLKVVADNIFCTDGYLQAPGLIENMAQTAAAQTGYLARQTQEVGEPKAPPVGFIGAIKNLIIHQLPAVGKELVSSIEIEHQVLNFTLIKGRVKSGEELLAECQMKIFLKED